VAIPSFFQAGFQTDFEVTSVGTNFRIIDLRDQFTLASFDQGGTNLIANIEEIFFSDELLRVPVTEAVS